MGFERARQPEQIEQRRGDILRAAAALFAELGVEKTSLTAIAKRANLSKANIYRYFESREAIFLALLTADLRAWTEDLERCLAPLGGRDEDEAVIVALVESARRHERFAALVSVAASVLEHNVSAASLRTFKREFMQVSVRIINALHAALPTLSLVDTERFFRLFVGFASGAYASTHPPPHIVEILAEPEFSALCHDFHTSIGEQARLVLAGLRALAPSS